MKIKIIYCINNINKLNNEKSILFFRNVAIAILFYLWANKHFRKAF